MDALVARGKREVRHWLRRRPSAPAMSVYYYVMAREWLHLTLSCKCAGEASEA